MKSLVSLILLAGVGITACEPPTAPKGTQNCRFISFDVPPDCSGRLDSQVSLTSVSVSPTMLRAGDYFTASASAKMSNCYNVSQIVIVYGTHAYYGNPPSLIVTVVAVPVDTVVTFYAACGFGPWPVQTVTIQVLPAP